MEHQSGKSQRPAWYLNLLEQIDEFTACYEEKIKREKQQREAYRKKTEMEIKLAQERKTNKELTNQIGELNRRIAELNRVCSIPLCIGENDQRKLDNAKEMYELGKVLTGIRWNFSAPDNVAKGYIKSESRMLLQPFEVPEGDTEALWSVLESTAAPVWFDKENRPNNVDSIALHNLKLN